MASASGEIDGALIIIAGPPEPQPQPQPLGAITGSYDWHGLHVLQRPHVLQELHEPHSDLRPNRSINPIFPSPQHPQPTALQVNSTKAVRDRSLFMAVISVKNRSENFASRGSSNCTPHGPMCKRNG